MIVRMLLRWGRRLLVVGIVASLVAVVVCRVFDPPITPLAVIRAGQAIVTGRLPGFSRSWRDLDAISPSLVRAVIASEDDAFFTHHGLDIGAIRRARAWNERHPDRPPRGASTITMQTARNVFLWPGRSYVRKALEAWFAVLMEVLWGKRRILEVYLNVIEWGDGVYGAEAAARRWFGVSAEDLSPRQAALLAAALPHPLRSDPGAPSRYLRARATVIERRASRVDLRSLGRLAKGPGARPKTKCSVADSSPSRSVRTPLAGRSGHARQPCPARLGTTSGPPRDMVARRATATPARGGRT